MFDVEKFINTAPYSLDHQQKKAFYNDVMRKLALHHYQSCQPYKKIIDTLNFDLEANYALEDLPFIPVRLFKTNTLASVPDDGIIKTMTSSGTTGQSVSKIFLDSATATAQTKALAKITAQFVGPKRLPMLVIDSPAVIKNRKLFSARGAGILGFSMLGRDVTYALDDDMQLDLNAIEAFCEKYPDQPILIFGFTYMIWKYFYQALVSQKRKLPLKNAIIIHGGGWKKLANLAVDADTFKLSVRAICGAQHIHNYYGMVEQTGSIFMECDEGHLHSSIFSDIIFRDAQFNVCKVGELGMIQLLSLLPMSYPGHSILSEDIGMLLGEDDCACGRLGKYFHVYGRIKQAEIRGCSDTHAAS